MVQKLELSTHDQGIMIMSRIGMAVQASADKWIEQYCENPARILYSMEIGPNHIHIEIVCLEKGKPAVRYTNQVHDAQLKEVYTRTSIELFATLQIDNFLHILAETPEE